MRGMNCRSLRLKLVAGLGIALGMPLLTVAAASAQGVATQTSLSVATRDHGGRTDATVTVNVTGADGQPASGGVSISDGGKPLAGVALNAQGQGSTVLTLAGGNHDLTAAYTGDTTHAASTSTPNTVTALTGSTPDFTISIAPTTETLTAGQSATVITTITPVNASGLTSPLFVTVSCSALPDQTLCNFTPENLEILPGASTPLTSTMVLETQASGTAMLAHPGGNGIAWALLLPGMLGLGGLAWGTRRRPWLNRLALLALVALVTTLSTTACNPRYYYLNHGPPVNTPTPSGSYTIYVTAQSSNGVTATTHSTTLALTVK